MPTLSECIRIFLQVDRSPFTNNHYKMVLDKMATSIGPDRAVTLIRYEDLMDYMAHVRASGIKSTTLIGYTSVIKSFFNWCVERRYIEQSPAGDIRHRVTPRDPSLNKAIPSDELKRMVEYARLTSPRNHAMLLFMVDTGCRVGGLVSLTTDNLHLDEMFAWLFEKGGRWHKALFGEETATALRLWLAKRPTVNHKHVWTGNGPDYEAISRSGIVAILRRISRKTEASQLWGPHSIRHAVGQAYAKAGIPITVTQHKLGHAHPSTTAVHYYPNDDRYLTEISRKNALLPIKEDQPSQPEKPKTIHIVERKKFSG